MIEANDDWGASIEDEINRTYYQMEAISNRLRVLGGEMSGSSVETPKGGRVVISKICHHGPPSKTDAGWVIMVTLERNIYDTIGPWETLEEAVQWQDFWFPVWTPIVDDTLTDAEEANESQG